MGGGRLKVLVAFPVAGLGASLVAGAVFWGGFNWSMELTNTEEFCVSCHAMMDKLHGRMKAEGMNCRQCHEDKTGRPLLGDKSTAYVCKNRLCDLPVDTPAALSAQLDKLVSLKP